MRLQLDESKSGKRQSTLLVFVVCLSLLFVGQLAFGLIAVLQQTKMVGDINDYSSIIIQKEGQYEPGTKMWNFILSLQA